MGIYYKMDIYECRILILIRGVTRISAGVGPFFFYGRQKNSVVGKEKNGAKRENVWGFLPNLEPYLPNLNPYLRPKIYFFVCLQLPFHNCCIIDSVPLFRL